MVWVFNLHGSPNKLTAQHFFVVDNESHFAQLALRGRNKFFGIYKAEWEFVHQGLFKCNIFWLLCKVVDLKTLLDKVFMKIVTELLEFTN